MDYHDHIDINPNRRGGKPCVKGTRISVYDVLDFLGSGMSVLEIISDYPDLHEDDIQACLVFAADRERKLAG